MYNRACNLGRVYKLPRGWGVGRKERHPFLQHQGIGAIVDTPLGNQFCPKQCLLLPTKMATVHRHLILTTFQEITGKEFYTVDNCPCFSPAPRLCLVFLVGLQVTWMRLRLQTSFVTSHQDISWSESVLLARMKACLCWQSRLVTMGLFRFELRLVKDHSILLWYIPKNFHLLFFFVLFFTSLEIALVQWG